jgi:hypothetical protein
MIRNTAAQMAEALAKGETTSVELTQAHLDRIAAVDGQVKAFLHVDSQGALAQAKDVDGNSFLAGSGVDGEVIAKFVPHYPKQLVSHFALGASKTIDKIAEEAIELILPRDLENIARQRTSVKAKGMGINE